MRTPERGANPWKSAAVVLAAVILLGWMAGSAGAQDDEQVAIGKITYRVYCQNCHGAGAKGDGKLAELMKVRPTDLTQLSKKNGGAYPADEVAGVIDGRAYVLAHGDREMPVWGQNFLDKTGSEDDVKTKVRQLVLFLESVQAK
ncbi:MAG TPA: cytochrome c [Thermoanaerobaculia bacterium]